MASVRLMALMGHVHFFFLISKQNFKNRLIFILFFIFAFHFILFYFLQNNCSKKIKLNRKNTTKMKKEEEETEK